MEAVFPNIAEDFLLEKLTWVFAIGKLPSCEFDSLDQFWEYSHQHELNVEINTRLLQATRFQELTAPMLDTCIKILCLVRLTRTCVRAAIDHRAVNILLRNAQPCFHECQIDKLLSLSRKPHETRIFDRTIRKYITDFMFLTQQRTFMDHLIFSTPWTMAVMFGHLRARTVTFKTDVKLVRNGTLLSHWRTVVWFLCLQERVRAARRMVRKMVKKKRREEQVLEQQLLEKQREELEKRHTCILKHVYLILFTSARYHRSIATKAFQKWQSLVTKNRQARREEACEKGLVAKPRIKRRKPPQQQIAELEKKPVDKPIPSHKERRWKIGVVNFREAPSKIEYQRGVERAATSIINNVRLSTDKAMEERRSPPPPVAFDNYEPSSLDRYDPSNLGNVINFVKPGQRPINASPILRRAILKWILFKRRQIALMERTLVFYLIELVISLVASIKGILEQTGLYKSGQDYINSVNELFNKNNEIGLSLDEFLKQRFAAQFSTLVENKILDPKFASCKCIFNHILFSASRYFRTLKRIRCFIFSGEFSMDGPLTKQSSKVCDFLVSKHEAIVSIPQLETFKSVRNVPKFVMALFLDDAKNAIYLWAMSKKHAAQDVIKMLNFFVGHHVKRRINKEECIYDSSEES